MEWSWKKGQERIWNYCCEREISVRVELGLSLKCNWLYRNEEFVNSSEFIEIETQVAYAKTDTGSTYMNGV